MSLFATREDGSPIPHDDEGDFNNDEDDDDSSSCCSFPDSLSPPSPLKIRRRPSRDRNPSRRPPRLRHASTPTSVTAAAAAIATSSSSSDNTSSTSPTLSTSPASCASSLITAAASGSSPTPAPSPAAPGASLSTALTLPLPLPLPHDEASSSSSSSSSSPSFSALPPSALSPQVVTAQYQRVLRQAVRSGDSSGVRRLLEAREGKINLNVFDADGQTALHESCQLGHLELVKVLVRFGADVRLANRDGWSAVHIAAFGGHTDILLFLMQATSLACRRC